MIGNISPLKQLRQALLEGNDDGAVEILTQRYENEGKHGKALCLKDELDPSALFPLTHQKEQTPLHLACATACFRTIEIFLTIGNYYFLFVL